MFLGLFLVSSLNCYGQADYWTENYRVVYSKSFREGIITLKKKINLQDYYKNPLGRQFFRTTFAIELEYNNKTTTTVIDSVFYTQGRFYAGMIPSILIDENKNIISFFSASKTSNEDDYGMNGFVYRMYMNSNRWEKEIVFTGANFGWYSFFIGSDDGNPELCHFSYAGNVSLLSKRTSSGDWTTQLIGPISLETVRQQHPLWQNILITSVSGLGAQ